MAKPSDEKDSFVQRGVYTSSPLGTAVFIGLRALDGFVLQRALQVLNPLPGLFVKFGFKAPPAPPSGGPLLSMSAHDLTPFQAVIWAMSIGGALKHIFWVSFISKESMPVSSALIISLFNTFMNSLNTLAFSLASINPTWSENTLRISVPLFIAGILIETISELQRKAFKDNAKNKGKVYSGGLFGYARHINYFGYTVWRGAAALAGGGFAWGAFAALFFRYNFMNMSIPELDEYCSSKYGAQWEATKRKVPYALIPWLE